MDGNITDINQNNNTIRELTCINCPLGCCIRVEIKDGSIAGITGNTCIRGEKYARSEVTNPVRVVTSSVRVEGGARPVVSVKTAEPIPKDKIFASLLEMRSVVLSPPVRIGDVVLANIAGTGIDLIATSDNI